MNISAPFIHRPVATTLLAFAVLLAGVGGYLSLPVSPLPQVDFPTIQVTTQLPGANPDTIASLVTASLERQFGQIPSLTTMSSQSAFGFSQITLQFDLDRDIDAAAQDVQSAINSAASTLPRNLPYPPVYAKVNPADTPIVTLVLRSKTATLRAMSDFADTQIAPKLSEVPGVGRVLVEGGVRPAIRIQADLARLAANRMSMDDLRLAIVGANVAGAKGSLDGATQTYTLDANDQILEAKQYKNVVVNWVGGRPVMLKDVANVVEGLENSRVGGWYNGEPAVILDVFRQPGANIIGAVEALKKELPHLQSALPSGISLDIVNDRTGTIRASIADVKFTLVVAIVLVVLVVLLFLRSVRATIIAGISLPLSIVATFGVMWSANLWSKGFSIDNLSLMALTIGTGFVVDDAIVMIENIVRNVEKGKTPLAAALDGAREIGFTVVSLTVSLIAVFIPLLFMTGIVGRMFREFALTLTMAVVVSALVSLTLTPMLCARLLRPFGGQAGAHEQTPSSWLDRLYARTLDWSLRRQPLILMVTVATLVLTIALYIVIPKGFLPRQDTGVLSAVLEASPDISFDALKKMQREVAAIFQADKDVTGVASVLGVGPLNPTTNVGHFMVTLRDHDHRSDGADRIADRLQAQAEAIPGATLYLEPVPDIQITTKASRSQYQYTITAADSDELLRWSEKLVDALRDEPALRNVAAETQNGGLRHLVRIDRETMGRLGISMQNVDDVLNDAFGQRQISTIYTQSNQYRVILEASEHYQRDPKALEKLYVAAPGRGAQTPLGSIVHIDKVDAPLSVAHQEQFPASTISFDLGPQASLGDALKVIARVEREIGLPSSIFGAFSGDAAEFDKSLRSEPYLILAAIIAIYIVLGVLYESFIHPFTVLTTLPSAGVGALLALMLFRLDLSIVALIGIILLMGIVKKNAIMMIDFALDIERNEGASPEESIVRACHLRFRPIMMTTLAALLGALPLALSHGAGSELRVPLGVSIIGGLLLSQLLTLYTTPVIYLAVERLRRRLFGARPREGAPPHEAMKTALAEASSKHEAPRQEAAE
jgi:multidrug efflux pump